MEAQFFHCFTTMWLQFSGGLPCGFDGWGLSAAISHPFAGWSAESDSSGKRVRRRGEAVAVKTLACSSPPFTLHFHIWSTAFPPPECVAAGMDVWLREILSENQSNWDEELGAFKDTEVTLKALVLLIQWFYTRCYEVTGRWSPCEVCIGKIHKRIISIKD